MFLSKCWDWKGFKPVLFKSFLESSSSLKLEIIMSVLVPS